MTIIRKCPECGTNCSNFKEVQEGYNCHVCWTCKKVWRIYEYAEQVNGD